MDIGEHDWTLTFRRERDFRLANGKPYINYVNSSNIVQFTVSQLGTATFQDLDVETESTVTSSGVRSGVKIRIMFNDTKEKTYDSDTYPTIGQLVVAMQKDFPELRVERMTVPGYPTRNIQNRKDMPGAAIGEKAPSNLTHISFPDGILTLSGYDVENFTYKLLKLMGGMVNGISVV